MKRPESLQQLRNFRSQVSQEKIADEAQDEFQVNTYNVKEQEKHLGDINANRMPPKLARLHLQLPELTDAALTQ